MTLTLEELAERLGAKLNGDGRIEVHRVATVHGADAGAITFLANRRYRSFLRTTRASAVILGEEFVGQCPVAALVMENPYLGYARVARWLTPDEPCPAGAHPSAVVDPGAQVAESAWVGANAVVQQGAWLGERVQMGPGSVAGPGVRVGNDTRIGANVSLAPGVLIGERGLIHPGVVIGADGFGIANDHGVWVKVPQLGAVRIGHDVEIGANTTIDRGALEDTIIEDGVKLDNLIQVGHNVRIGAHTAIAACVAIGGSARIGARCTIAGAASIGGHLEIADDVHLTAPSAVPNSIKTPGVYSSGMPVQENRKWRRNVVRMGQLDDMARRIRALEDGSG